MFFLSIRANLTPAEWLARHAPDTTPGEPARALCLECWKAANGRRIGFRWTADHPRIGQQRGMVEATDVEEARKRLAAQGR